MRHQAVRHVGVFGREPLGHLGPGREEEEGAVQRVGKSPGHFEFAALQVGLDELEVAGAVRDSPLSNVLYIVVQQQGIHVPSIRVSGAGCAVAALGLAGEAARQQVHLALGFLQFALEPLDFLDLLPLPAELRVPRVNPGHAVD